MSEVSLLLSIRSLFEGGGALAAWTAVTRLGDGGVFWIAFGLFLACFKGFRHASCAIGTALFTGFLICNVTLKPLFDRLRPCEVHPEELIYACPPDASFPSGHTTASFAAALAFSAFFPRSGAALLTLAVLIAWSRLYLFVHWPTDVAFGILIGTVSAAIAVHLTTMPQEASGFNPEEECVCLIALGKA